MAPACNISPAIWRLVQGNPELRDGCATHRQSQEKGKGCRNASVQHALEPGSDPGSTSAGWHGPQVQLLRYKVICGYPASILKVKVARVPRHSQNEQLWVMNDKNSYIPQLCRCEAHSSP